MNTLENNQIQAMIGLLRKPVKVVPHNRQIIAFHFNTKMAHLLAWWRGILELAQGKPGEPEAKEAFLEWRALAGDFVACLPDIRVPDGEDPRPLTDPLACLRQAFPSNKSWAPGRIPKIVARMWTTAKEAAKTISQAPSPQDHQNLVELAVLCGFLPTEAGATFFKEVFGREKTPAQELEDSLDELEGAAMEGSVQKHPFAGGTLYQQAGRKWVVQGDTLHIEGNGCISTFSLITHGKQVAVIDLAERPQTSITNLAEAAHEAITSTLGADTQVFEAYLHDLKEETGGLIQILRTSSGEPRWLWVTENTSGLIEKLRRAAGLSKGPSPIEQE
jgi:hypothetical protein